MHEHILQKLSNKTFGENYSHHKLRRGHGELCNAVVPNTHWNDNVRKFWNSETQGSYTLQRWVVAYGSSWPQLRIFLICTFLVRILMVVVDGGHGLPDHTLPLVLVLDFRRNRTNNYPWTVVLKWLPPQRLPGPWLSSPLVMPHGHQKQPPKGFKKQGVVGFTGCL